MTLKRNDPRHGTRNGYQKHGCGCDDCKAAHAAYSREWVRRNPEKRKRVRTTACPNCGGKMTRGNGVGRDPAICIDCRRKMIEPAHGTANRYSSAKWKCRCDECRAAWAAYARGQYAKKKAAA